MKRTPFVKAVILGTFLAPIGWAAPGSSDTSWGADLSDELPADVRARLRSLKQESREEKSSRPAQEVKKDLRGQREKFLQSLPETERVRLRQKIQQFEERPVQPRDPHDFRDK